MEFQRCSGFFADENNCSEDFYLILDIIPIIVVWGLFLIAILLFGASYLCLCCRGTAVTQETSKLAKVLIGVYKFGNLLVRLVFGGKLGLVRESQQETVSDEFGREKLFINQYPIQERAHFLHFMLGMKVLVFLAFCLASGVDIFFVDSDLSCDASRDCYIFNDDYTQLPVTNCSEFIDNPNETTVCYAIVLDLLGAASTMGGLLSSTIIETAIIAYVSIFLYTKCCCECCGKYKRYVWVVLQYVCALMVLSVFMGLYAAYIDKSRASQLRKTGDWISFLGHLCSVAFSMVIPWHYAVDPEQCKLSHCLSGDEEQGNPRTNRTTRNQVTDGQTGIPEEMQNIDPAPLLVRSMAVSTHGATSDSAQQKRKGYGTVFISDSV